MTDPLAEAVKGPYCNKYFCGDLVEFNTKSSGTVAHNSVGRIIEVTFTVGDHCYAIHCNGVTERGIAENQIVAKLVRA